MKFIKLLIFHANFADGRVISEWYGFTDETVEKLLHFALRYCLSTYLRLHLIQIFPGKRRKESLLAFLVTFFAYDGYATFPITVKVNSAWLKHVTLVCVLKHHSMPLF